MDEKETNTSENSGRYREIMQFIKTLLDDEGIEKLIEETKGEYCGFESEEQLRKHLREIRDDKSWD